MSAWHVIHSPVQFSQLAKEKTQGHPLGWCSRFQSFYDNEVISANNGAGGGFGPWLAESAPADRENQLLAPCSQMEKTAKQEK
ncbi:MAG: hypothetical protein R3B74_07555 [Nitrospirales bacterium]|nr:hypothetical protein [Nitrospirales bacterium]